LSFSLHHSTAERICLMYLLYWQNEWVLWLTRCSHSFQRCFRDSTVVYLPVARVKNSKQSIYLYNA
jgi:hypothetical protein